MYIDQKTLHEALQRLYGTSGHLLKIWLTLKHMGLSTTNPSVEIDTSNSTLSLQRLFSYGATDDGYYIPFAHSPRWLTMKSDASRSIIQTNIQRWASSGSVVSCDPTSFLDFQGGQDSKLLVAPGRRYPFGLGIEESGFALKNGTRVSIPINSFAVWYGRQTRIPEDTDPLIFLISNMLKDLHITPDEKELIFVEDDLAIKLSTTKLDNRQVFSICHKFISNKPEPYYEVHHEEFSHYTRRVKSMISNLSLPVWMRSSPESELEELLKAGAKSILIYGPPRTGKTRIIDKYIPRDDESRCTIQIHDGWGYDHLVEGFKPDIHGNWRWEDGPLKEAIESNKKCIVLEEINRTAIAQALGEVFSLLEESYRGESNGILLRSGKKFWIPEDVVFFMTMNTIDKSTEDVDDALLGRVAAVEFPPRPEDFNEMLSSNLVPKSTVEKLSQVYSEVLDLYPLGHGYFAGLSGEVSNKNIISYYKTRVRPVLVNFLGELKKQELTKVDNLIDDLFNKV